MREITIKEADNGYIVTVQHFDSSDVYVVEGEEAATKLLTTIADELGYHYDKFSETNLNITWDKKGHKVE